MPGGQVESRTNKDGDAAASQIHLDALFGEFQEKDPVLEFPKFHNVQPVEKGSGVLSNVRDERIMARRRRLEQRAHKLEASEDAEGLAAGTADKRTLGHMPSFEPVSESAKNFRRTVDRQDDVLQSFVKTICQRRINRRLAIRQHFEHLENRIKKNKVLSTQRLSAKFTKYSEISHKTLSLDELVLLLEKYRSYGKELVKSKQAFVEEIEDELKSVDDNFSRMLKSFQRDIDGIKKKATEFCTKLTALGRREIYDLDKTFSGIENDYVRKIGALWDKGHAQVRSKDDAVTVQREGLMDEILGNLKLLRTAKLDAHMEVKLILDNDVILMTEQLQNMRASFLVNAEKLDYNLEIIQLREEESLKTKNKQKRIITKIQDEAARATNELRTEEKKVKHKLGKYKGHYMDSTRELIQMHQTNDEQVSKEWAMFRDCWISNELALRDTFRSLVLLDRFITEEICSLPWRPPSLWFLTHIGPIHAPRWRQMRQLWPILDHQMDKLHSGHSALSSADQSNLKKDYQHCWQILNLRSKRLSQFRQLSLIRRPDSGPRNGELKDYNTTEKSASTTELPAHILGPVLRWILSHLDFLNEDYTVDVLNQMHWQDKFCFRIQAFLDEFPTLKYEDLCELAVFFLRYSQHANAKQARNEPVSIQDDEVQEMLRHMSAFDLRDVRMEFNDVFAALQAFLDYKRNKVVENVSYDLVQAQGKGRDGSADMEYIDMYLHAFDLRKKAIEWEQLLYGIRKEAQTSENKLKLTSATKTLYARNQHLKGIMHAHMSQKLKGHARDAYEQYIFPPLWSRMDEVAHELSHEISRTPPRHEKGRAAVAAAR